MAKVNYVACPACDREYYIDRILSDALVKNPAQSLKCPFCKTTFNYGAKTSSDASQSQAASSR